METDNNLRVSDELLADLQEQATEAGKTVDHFVEETLRKSLEERSWQQLLAYGLENGRASGFTEADVSEIVRNRRRINAQAT